MNDYEQRQALERVKQMQIIKRVSKISIIVILALIVIFGSFRFVGAGQVGVVTRFGAVNRVAYPGMVLKLPILERVEIMDTRTQKDQVDASAASLDIQEVKAKISVNYHLDGSHATDVFQKIGTDYQDKVVSPAIQDTFKSITAKYTAPDLIAKREEVRVLALTELIEKMKPYNVVVDNFNIVNFDFSNDFNQAIENKVKAQQNKEQSQVEAETALIESQGQANAQKALRDSGALSPEYLEYLALTKWNGILPTVTGGGTPFINIPNK